MCEKAYIWNLVACICEIDKYVGSVIDDSVIKCNEIIEEKKLFHQKQSEQKPFQEVLAKKGNL